MRYAIFIVATLLVASPTLAQITPQEPSAAEQERRRQELQRAEAEAVEWRKLEEDQKRRQAEARSREEELKSRMTPAERLQFEEEEKLRGERSAQERALAADRLLNAAGRKNGCASLDPKVCGFGYDAASRMWEAERARIRAEAEERLRAETRRTAVGP